VPSGRARRVNELATAPILPVWLVAPMAGVTMLVLAAHVASLRSTPMPHSRKRIRTANGVLMMFATPMLAFVFGAATPSEADEFVIGWTIVSVMLSMILMLAVLDMLNTARLHRAELRRIRREALKGDALAGLSDAARARLRAVGAYDGGDDA